MSGSTRPWSRARARLEAFDWSDDSGQVGGIEVLPFGVLVFVVGSLLVVNAWAVIDCKLAADGAAREAVRTYVESSSRHAADESSEVVARDAVEAHGRDRAKLVVDPPALSGGGFVRCARVTITVHYPVPWITLPIIGGRGDGFVVTSTHSGLIDPYRSDVPGEAAC